MNEKWAAEERTGLELVVDWVRRHRSKAQAAREIGIEPAHLRIWLLQPDRRFDPETGRKVALATGIPFEAIMFKNRSVCDLAAERHDAPERPAEAAAEGAA